MLTITTDSSVSRTSPPTPDRLSARKAPQEDEPGRFSKDFDRLLKRWRRTFVEDLIGLEQGLPPEI